MAGTGFAETTPYGNLECGRAKWSQRVARPSLERGGPDLDAKVAPAIGKFFCCPQMFCKQISDALA